MPAVLFNFLRFLGVDMTDQQAVSRRVGERLGERNETLATAESVTGGMLSAAIVDVPGASDYFDRGYVTYAYEAKSGTLGVDRALLDQHGAVSEPVAAAMAQAARDLAGCTWGVSVTGTAGPSGGTEEKPVGTTFIGVAHAGPWGSQTSTSTVNRYRFEGNRMAIRRAAVSQALTDLDEHVAAHPTNSS